MSIRRHERDVLCKEAQLDMGSALNNVREQHDLTDIEYLQAVSSVCADAIASYAQYELRIERHGNPDVPSGIVGSGKKSPVTHAFVSDLVEQMEEAFGEHAMIPDYDTLFNLFKRLLDEEFGE